MVERGICQQGDQALLNDAFRSFPSGYATVAFAGLWYLSLWLCEQFGLYPFVSTAGPEPLEIGESSEPLLSESEMRRPASRQLPLYYLFLPYLPLGVAIFIAGTRFFDFRNHGIDVVAGSAAGMAVGHVGWKWRLPK
ncbi:hypothetical protein BDY17DRAFT_302741 [Neohortaea acidophila]|uniref:Phosphatidic acid phosphatase type 2/haloperoxidase domain-containing protein n=1 Tax=Neohortaea acidophila TaxID=245834 RepID=A0A6A6PJY1_9PEZI|nr:uncharacterized protein BDY17DRAFT_302741 [Neohortaea acidophila]KAF2479823.1 hypothetical protein BDY17DRAFT_302741 [Neohortaea acidophila]